MRVFQLTNCEKRCSYLVMKKLSSCVGHPNKDEYSSGDKAPSSESHSLHILCCQQ